MTALWRLFILEVYFSCKCLILKNGGLKHSFLLTFFFFYFLNQFLTICAAAITPLVWTWQTPSWFLPRKRSVKCSGSVWVGKENPTPGALCGKTSRRISGAGTPTLPNPCLKFVGCVWKLENHRKSELRVKTAVASVNGAELILINLFRHWLMLCGVTGMLSVLKTLPKQKSLQGNISILLNALMAGMRNRENGMKSWKTGKMYHYLVL